MDEVKLFDRALNSSEIQQDFDYVMNGIPDDQSPIPEPASIILLLGGLVKLIVRKKGSI